MTSCPSTPSTADTVDALIYSHFKRTNPEALLDLFSKEKRKTLERNYHQIEPDLLKTMWKNYRIQKSAQKSQLKLVSMEESPEPNQEAAESWKTDWMHGRFCSLRSLRKSTDLALYHHFKSKLHSDNFFQDSGEFSRNFKALEKLFDEETRQQYEKLMQTTDVPSFKRMLAFYRLEELKPKRKPVFRRTVIFKCRLCKKEVRGERMQGNEFLLHIGKHEKLHCYCFMEGCDKSLKTCKTLVMHVNEKHNLRSSELDSRQYHLLMTAKTEFYRKAAKFLDRYFPPESFVRFFNRKKRNATHLKDPKCQDCGEVVRDGHAQRRHIATHLELSFKCVVEGCETTFTPPTFLSAHLLCRHNRKIRDLTEKELFAHKKAKEDFNKQIEEEVPKFFRIKPALMEDSK
ncbi:hypothetical protein L596_009338 [Steinernema carpocapsae]|uniref:C2H2-type domain-containing protein n=1 Tax=Steinernema carpocapsae TaxID=34508 RepID=A0A4U5PF87_STECR|nr:hypothetical protein L596_009338 [Steinernema carpocapsae]